MPIRACSITTYMQEPTPEQQSEREKQEAENARQALKLAKDIFEVVKQKEFVNN